METAKRHRSVSAWLATASLVTFTMLSPQFVLADRPGVAGNEGSTDPGPPPLTRDQVASSDVRLGQVQALIDYELGGGITPQGVCEGNEDPPCQLPPPSSYSLATHARHQHRSFYCGTAVVQVVSNYTRGYTSPSTCGGTVAEGCPATINRYDQHTISNSWTNTDLHGQTYVGDLVAGLNGASILPAGYIYAYWTNMSWSQFHNAIKVDTYTWRMPLAPRVDPRHTGSQYYLYSWRNNSAGSYGHYITLRGYSGSSQSSALAYYNDSAGGTDEHTGIGIPGSTGAFSDKSYTVYKTMTLRTTLINGVNYYYLVW